MKKYFYYFLILILAVYTIFHFTQKDIIHNANNTDFSKTPYITDSKQMQDIFSRVDVIRCWWKQIKIGRNSIGPTQYIICGFIQIDKAQVDSLKNKFPFSESNPDFKKGVSTSVTGMLEFKWHESELFSKYILSKFYTGQIHLDTQNGIIYFELQKL